MNYRWLIGREATDAEWDRLEMIFSARGWMSLNRDTTAAILAEDDDGSLVGFFCLQLIPHIEPLWVAPSARGSDVPMTLIDKMQEYLFEAKARGCMLVAENPTMKAVAESRGMHKVEDPVYIYVRGGE